MPEDIYYEQPAEEPVKQEDEPSALARLLEVQLKLKVEKGNWNSFGKYSFRSKEDILEAAKPLCAEYGFGIIMKDQVRIIENGWPYVVTTVQLFDTLAGGWVKVDGEPLVIEGWAREPETKRGMDSSQITGTAASYAGKRALGNLFALDDTKDADGLPQQGQTVKQGNAPVQQSPAPVQQPQQVKQPVQQSPFTAHCTNCGARYTFNDMASYANYTAMYPCCSSPNWVVE